jgi:3-oxoacyl-[acyl-carrier protein] reductase
MRIDGARALVIGGGGEGIGRGITRAFAAAGASVAVADLEPKRADVAAGEIVAGGGRACAISGDVRLTSDVDAMVASTVRGLGGLDVLVTVVGGQVALVPAVKLHEMTDEDWDLVFELNLRYVARAARAAIRTFMVQGHGGAIVSVGSVTGFMAAPRQAGYGAAKAGLLSLAKTVAAEYASDGIRMNVIAAGAIATAVTASYQDPDGMDRIPMGRYGSVADVASAAVFLASPSSSYMTGQCLVLDGGVSVRGPFA